MIDGDFLICFRIKHRNIIYQQRQGLYNLSFLDNLQHMMLLLIYANLVVYTYKKKGDSDIQVVGYSPSSPPFENILILVNLYSLPLPRRYMFMFPFLYQPGCLKRIYLFFFFALFFLFAAFFQLLHFPCHAFLHLKLGVNHVKCF